MLFTNDQQCELDNYVNYANLKQKPATAHLSTDEHLKALDILWDLRSQLVEKEAEASIENEKQVYLSELDLAVCMYISEMQKKLEQIKRVTIWVTCRRKKTE